MERVSQILMLAVALFEGFLLMSSGQERPSPKWKPGTYKGLITGVSTMQDVIRKLGKPKLKTLAETNDPTEWEWHYKQIESKGSCCEVSFKKGILQRITLDLGEVERSKATQLFGGRFITVRFSTDYTHEKGGSAPLCEDPTGDQVLLLDPTRGLSLWVEPDGMVSGATFGSTRPGTGKCHNK
jgi:hypothetical protein